MKTVLWRSNPLLLMFIFTPNIKGPAPWQACACYPVVLYYVDGVIPSNE